MHHTYAPHVCHTYAHTCVTHIHKHALTHPTQTQVLCLECACATPLHKTVLSCGWDHCRKHTPHWRMPQWSTISGSPAPRKHRPNKCRVGMLPPFLILQLHRLSSKTFDWKQSLAWVPVAVNNCACAALKVLVRTRVFSFWSSPDRHCYRGESTNWFSLLYFPRGKMVTVYTACTVVVHGVTLLVQIRMFFFIEGKGNN